MNNENLNNSFIKSIQNKIIDINIDYSEVLLDSIINDDTLKEIPIVKTLVSLSKIGVTIKNQFLIKKILRFLSELDSISEKEKQQFLKNLDKRGIKNTIIDNLLIIIDRLDHDDKAQIMGKLFKSLIMNNIDNDMFFRLLHILDKVYIHDLIILNGHYNRKLSIDTRTNFLYKLNELVKSNLANFGLMIPIFDNKIQDIRASGTGIGEVKIKDYKISMLGKTMIEHGF